MSGLDGGACPDRAGVRSCDRGIWQAPPSTHEWRQVLTGVDEDLPLIAVVTAGDTCDRRLSGRALRWARGHAHDFPSVTGTRITPKRGIANPRSGEPITGTSGQHRGDVERCLRG